jgi:arabinosaccharide transport system substrate-binding protein
MQTQGATRWEAAMDRLGDWFPFGKAPLIILLLVLVSGGWLLLHPVKRTQATLRFWTFADTHYYAYLNAKPSFEAAHPGQTVDFQFVHGQAVTTRLRAAFWANLDVPDMVEVEISAAGSFFRGPSDDIGFEDLTPRLKAEGLFDRMVKARFAPYTHRGRIYGLPHDVHPVMLAYRRDIFEAEGIDVSKLQTWDDLIAIGRRVTIPDKRYLLDFPDASPSGLEMCLFQRDGGYFDSGGRCIMDSPVAVETLKWYIPLVAGPNMIADDPGWGQPWVKAVEDGYLLTFTCPDWRSKFTEQQIARMAGKLALMPLPAVKPGGRRTSSWGGTMLGLTKACPNKDLAWQLAKHLYLNPEELAKRFRDTNILPALKEAWTHEAINEPRPYWSNQPIGKLYAELAGDVPPQYASPYIEFAKGKLSEVVSSCANYYKKNGEAGFAAFAEARLKGAADEVREMMKRNPF